MSDNFKYVPSLKNECDVIISSIIKEIENIKNEITIGNNKDVVKCNTSNIENALTNAKNVQRELNDLENGVNQMNKQMAEYLGLEEDKNILDMFNSMSLTGQDSLSLSLDGEIGEEKITIEEMQGIVNSAGSWAKNEKDKEIMRLFNEMVIKYYYLASTMPNTLNNFTLKTFESVNVGFDEEKGETYETYQGEIKYETKEEKLHFFKSLTTGEIVNYFSNSKGIYDVDIMMLSEDEVPEQLSHIPQYLWDESLGDTIEETEYNRALLMLSFSSNPKEDINWFRGKMEGDWKIGIADKKYTPGGYIDNDLMTKHAQIQQEELNPISTELIMDVNLLDGVSYLLKESYDENGKLKSGEELCEVFNQTFSKVTSSYNNDEFTRESLDRKFIGIGIKPEVSESAWFETVKEFYPEDIGEFKLPTDKDSIEYKTYNSLYGSTDLLLAIREEQGDEAVFDFLNRYYEKCGKDIILDNDTILGNLDLLKKKNIRINEICKPIMETSQTLNQISLFEKNVIDMSAKRLEIPSEIKDDPSKYSEFANSLGIDGDDIKLFSEYQMDAYLYLNKNSIGLSREYGDILKEIVMDSHAQASAQQYVKNTLGTGNNFIDSFFMSERTLYNFFGSSVMGLGNFVEDIGNVFSYDGKVSSRQLEQMYISQYYTSDYSIYKDYDSESNKQMLSKVEVDDISVNNNQLLTSSQIEECNKYLASCKENNYEPKLYEVYYETGIISKEEYLKYKTLEDTNDEIKEWYKFLANQKSERSYQGTIYNVGMGFGYMAIPLGLNAVGCPNVGNSLLSLAVAGNSMETLAQSGETNRSVIAIYGLLNAAKSFGVERMGGFFSPSGKNIIDLEGILGKVKIGNSGLPKNVIKLFANSGDEVLEEVVELFLGYGLDSHFNPDAVPNSFEDVFNETTQTMWQTFLTTPLMSGYSQGIAGKVNAQRNINTAFGNYNLSFNDVLRFTDFDGNIKYNELFEYVKSNGKISFYDVNEVKNNFNNQFGFNYVKNISFNDGLYTIDTTDGIRLTYNAFGELVQEEINSKTKNIVESNNIRTLNSLENIFKSKNYEYLGHGTGRSDDSVISSIFELGLRTKNNSLYYTTDHLENNLSKMQEQLNHWGHLDSDKIVLIRLPVEYINQLGERDDSNGERYRAFYNEVVQSNGDIRYYLDPKFIIGVYDRNIQAVRINDSFEENLSQESIEKIENRYEAAVNEKKEKYEKNESISQYFGRKVEEPLKENILEEKDIEVVDWDYDEWNDIKTIDSPLSGFDSESFDNDLVLKHFADTISQAFSNHESVDNLTETGVDIAKEVAPSSFKIFTSYEEFIEKNASARELWVNSLNLREESLIWNYMGESERSSFLTMNGVARNTCVNSENGTVTFFHYDGGKKTYTFNEYENRYGESVSEMVDRTISECIDLDNAIRRSKLSQDTIVYRGVDMSALEKYGIEMSDSAVEIMSKLGDTYYDPGFMSATPVLAGPFSHKNVIFSIECPAGTSCADLSTFDKLEKEILFPLGQTCSINNVEKKDGKIYIHMSLKGE